MTSELFARAARTSALYVSLKRRLVAWLVVTRGAVLVSSPPSDKVVPRRHGKQLPLNLGLLDLRTRGARPGSLGVFLSE